MDGQEGISPRASKRIQIDGALLPRSFGGKQQLRPRASKPQAVNRHTNSAGSASTGRTARNRLQIARAVSGVPRFTGA